MHEVVYTDQALGELDDILNFLAIHYPTVFEPFKRRLKNIEARLSRWPHSAPAVQDRPGVRVVTVARYPYRVFYRVRGNAVEILHIHHARREQAI